jgi:hypothetical protein
MKITITITDIDQHELTQIATALGGKISVTQSFADTDPDKALQATRAAAPASVVTPPAAASAPAPAPAAPKPAPAEREPGGDDGNSAKPGDEVFARCTTMKEVVKEIVRRGVREEKEVLAELQRLQEGGLAVLKPIAPAVMAERVNITLTALGVIEG